jgi:hypothetical protein
MCRPAGQRQQAHLNAVLQNGMGGRPAAAAHAIEAQGPNLRGGIAMAT